MIALQNNVCSISLQDCYISGKPFKQDFSTRSYYMALGYKMWDTWIQSTLLSYKQKPPHKCCYVSVLMCWLVVVIFTARPVRSCKLVTRIPWTATSCSMMNITLLPSVGPRISLFTGEFVQSRENMRRICCELTRAIVDQWCHHCWCLVHVVPITEVIGGQWMDTWKHSCHLWPCSRPHCCNHQWGRLFTTNVSNSLSRLLFYRSAFWIHSWCRKLVICGRVDLRYA